MQFRKAISKLCREVHLDTLRSTDWHANEVGLVGDTDRTWLSQELGFEFFGALLGRIHFQSLTAQRIVRIAGGKPVPT